MAEGERKFWEQCEISRAKVDSWPEWKRAAASRGLIDKWEKKEPDDDDTAPTEAEILRGRVADLESGIGRILDAENTHHHMRRPEIIRTLKALLGKETL